MSGEKKAIRQNSQFREVTRRLLRNKKAIFAMVIILLLLVMVVFADVIAPYSKAVDLNIPNRLKRPCAEFWFGTDGQGRDSFARIVHGSRISLLMGVAATAIMTICGTLIGTTAAYFGGKVDDVIMRILDMWMAIPSLLITLAIIAGLNVGVPQMIFAIGFGGIPGFARVLRAAALGVVSQEYIESAKALGASGRRIIIRYVVPNIMSQMLIQATVNISGTILLGATLSFLGLGAQPPTPEWGAMLSQGLGDFQFYPHLVTIPGIFLAITALAINIFGDALRDAFDPKLKGKA